MSKIRKLDSTTSNPIIPILPSADQIASKKTADAFETKTKFFKSQKIQWNFQLQQIVEKKNTEAEAANICLQMELWTMPKMYM